MIIDGERHHLGFIRISGDYWSRNQKMILDRIGEGRVRNTMQTIQNGRYLDAVDVLIEDVQLDEIETGAVIPYYKFDLPTAKFTRLADDELTRASFSQFDDAWS